MAIQHFQCGALDCFASLAMTAAAVPALGKYAVPVEPGFHLLPAVLRRLLAVAWPVIGVKGMTGAGIDFEPGRFSRGRERGFHLLNLGNGNALSASP